MRSRLPVLLLVGFFLPAAQAESRPEPAPPTAPAGPSAPDAGEAIPSPDENEQSLLRIAETKTAAGDYATAEIAFRQLLAAPPHPERDHRVLLGLARLHRLRQEGARAAAIYEKLLRDSPQNPANPAIYLELARTLRSLGAYDLAIGRFYSVINATLNLPSVDPSDYRQLARTAQFELADTHLIAGHYDEASKLFERLVTLDLSPEDRNLARLQAASAHARAGRIAAAVSILSPSLTPEAGTPVLPEALHLQSTLLLQLDRAEEGLALVQRLLASEHEQRLDQPERWQEWQRRTGNQLANEFYERGDAAAALTIYQTLAAMDKRPEWRLSLVYQIGLCFERLAALESALIAYREVATAGAPTASPSGQLAELARMAAWRIRHLEWQARTTREWQQLIQPTVESTNPPEGPGTVVAAPTS
jgi:tetratricopeptide (TPR) repeat protein